MTFSDIIKDDMTTDNKPRFIWIRNGEKTGEHVNVNHIVSVKQPDGYWGGGYGNVNLSSGMGVQIILNKWDTADDVMRKIHAALAQ